MKTDKQKLMELLDGFGVEYDHRTYSKGKTKIKCNERKHKKVEGYGGFFTLFEFDENEKLTSMSAWE